MATQKQIDANRRNAKKSTGPIPPEGRAAVRLNSVKHGLTAGSVLVFGESDADFEALLDAMEAEHQPTTPTEAAMVRRIAVAHWRMLRSYRIETGFFNVRRIDMTDRFKNYTGIDANDRLALIVGDDTRNAKTLENLSTYEGRFERSFDKALRELQRLRSTRSSQTNKQSQFPPAAPEPAPGPPLEPPATNG